MQFETIRPRRLSLLLEESEEWRSFTPSLFNLTSGESQKQVWCLQSGLICLACCTEPRENRSTSQLRCISLPIPHLGANMRLDTKRKAARTATRSQSRAQNSSFLTQETRRIKPPAVSGIGLIWCSGDTTPGPHHRE